MSLTGRMKSSGFGWLVLVLASKRNFRHPTQALSSSFLVLKFVFSNLQIYPCLFSVTLYEQDSVMFLPLGLHQLSSLTSLTIFS